MLKRNGWILLETMDNITWPTQLFTYIEPSVNALMIQVLDLNYSLLLWLKIFQKYSLTVPRKS